MKCCLIILDTTSDISYVIRVVSFQKSKHFIYFVQIFIWTKGVCSVDAKTKESIDVFSEDRLQKLNPKKNWIQQCHK